MNSHVVKGYRRLRGAASRSTKLSCHFIETSNKAL